MTSASEVCFEPEPPTPSNKPANAPQILLVYTHIWTELLKMGVTWGDAVRMPWGVCRMLFASRAEVWEASKSASEKGDEDARYATAEDYSRWI